MQPSPLLLARNERSNTMNVVLDPSGEIRPISLANPTPTNTNTNPNINPLATNSTEGSTTTTGGGLVGEGNSFSTTTTT